MSTSTSTSTSTTWIVASPTGAALMTAEQLIEAAHRQFGEALRVQRSRRGWETDYHLYVTLPGEPEIEIAHFADNQMVGIAGTEMQNAWLSAWIRSLLPKGAPRVIAGDREWRGHAELPYGISPQRVLAEWVDHSAPGWDANDPDLR